MNFPNYKPPSRSIFWGILYCHIWWPEGKMGKICSIIHDLSHDCCLNSPSPFTQMIFPGWKIHLEKPWLLDELPMFPLVLRAMKNQQPHVPPRNAMKNQQIPTDLSLRIPQLCVDRDTDHNGRPHQQSRSRLPWWTWTLADGAPTFHHFPNGVSTVRSRMVVEKWHKLLFPTSFFIYTYKWNVYRIG